VSIFFHRDSQMSAPQRQELEERVEELVQQQQRPDGTTQKQLEQQQQRAQGQDDTQEAQEQERKERVEERV
jgi:hypothetical protein